MAKFDTFESNIRDILISEGILDTSMQFAKDVTGSSLFDTSGSVSTAYSGDKNYYPNIRGWAGIRNIKIDEANQNVITRVNQLILAGNNLIDPTQQIPTQLPTAPDVKIDTIVSNTYSPNFMSGMLDRINLEVNGVTQVINNIQGIPSTNAQKAIEDVTKTIELFNQNRSERAAQDISRATRVLLYELDPSKSHAFSGLSFLSKAHIADAISKLTDTVSRWNLYFKAGTQQNNLSIGTPENAVGDFLTKEDTTYKIYRDKWDDFLNTLQNAVVGAGQQRWSSGANAYTIVTGKGVSGRARFVDRSYTTVQSIGPDVLKIVHNNIIVPLFIKKQPVLMYLTPQQWESISKGGRFYKTLSGIGSQVFSAGANRPRVSL